jgi:hypothetical protein
MATKPEDGKIVFVEFHPPDLADGDYTLTVTQTIEAQEQISNKQNFSEKFPAATFRFSILGPRFTLDPQVITSVFPPAGSLGDYSNALPHIVFNRSTLPWERTAIKKDDPNKPKEEETRVSWLALLLLEENELAAPQPAPETAKENVKTFTVGELRASTTGKINWPGISPESGQHDGDRLSVIDVPWSCLKQITPTGDDLRFLTHVRKTEESTGKPGEDESAVVMGSRLPKPGSISCVHLVSVEGRYKYEGKQLVFDHRGAQDGDSIRLVSLKSWRFTCVDENNSFTKLLEHLDRSSSLRLLDPEWEGMAYREIREISDARHAARRYLAMGCVPLPHAMRQGNKTVSWYRGPLVPGNNTTKDFSLPIRSADELVYYDDTYGMFDVSYAAAWELGRLLALQSKSFSTNLYRWKRSHAWKIKDADTQLTHLPFGGPTADLELPETVRSWFENLTLLEGVPFHYLVPDERMLPAPESIRFFQVDPIWMECLVDGAFSIGRVLPSDHEQDKLHQHNKRNKVSGFLLRSDVVAGWPGLQVDGYDESGEDFLPKKLFEINSADRRSDLNDQKISDQLKEKFRETNIELSLEPWTVETRQWLINSGAQEFQLIKRENNQIDVCLAVDGKFLFSIDGGFETELDARDVSTELQQAFGAEKQVLSPDSGISEVSWFITDSQEKKHFLIEREDDVLRAYRDYKLPLLRMARLSANILICLFEGVVQTVDLHLKPDTLHCGLDKPDGDQKGFRKILRKLTAGNAGKSIDSVPLKDEERRVINIGALAEEIKQKTKATEFSAAEFSLEMIEGAEKVRFSLKS